MRHSIIRDVSQSVTDTWRLLMALEAAEAPIIFLCQRNVLLKWNNGWDTSGHFYCVFTFWHTEKVLFIRFLIILNFCVFFSSSFYATYQDSYFRHKFALYGYTYSFNHYINDFRVVLESPIWNAQYIFSFCFFFKADIRLKKKNYPWMCAVGQLLNCVCIYLWMR